MTGTQRSGEKRPAKSSYVTDVRPGILAMLRDLMTWGGFAQMVECLQTVIMNVHALGPEGARRLLEVPRHDFTPSENVAQQLYHEGQREAGRLDQKDQ